MVVDLNPLISVTGIIIALASIIFAVFIVMRCSGKLRNSMILLMGAILLFLLIQIGSITGITGSAIIMGNVTNLFEGGTIINIVNVAIILFILLALINIWKMIKNIDNPKKKK